ncbi:uncharacterized protein LOC106012614 [Aplysia californica]|uniref:Uncharacterized protein LOC106012614 n=1 Tax=Aplysia californica TaxID=6500 RepID=A0ABM1A621_APLCA|nr:uncharacterized protein LOC106012614 [Aplysia californica]
MSSQKKRRERERNRAYLQRKRDVPLPKTPPAQEPAPSTGVSASTISRVKKRFGKKLLPSLKCLMKSLFRKDPKKLLQQGLSYSSPSKCQTPGPDLGNFLKRRRDRSSLVVKRLFAGSDVSSLYKRRKFKDDGAAEGFFRDRSVHIPGKQGATKHGTRKILSSSVKSLYKDFTSEHGPLISRSTFFRKRPKNVLSFTKTPFRQCLCEICLNPMLIMKVLNSFISSRVDTLSELISLTLCGENVKCMRRECDECGVNAVDCLVENVEREKVVEWQRWERVCKNGSSRIDQVKKNGTLLEMCEQLKVDLGKLPLHDFVHRWQSREYRTLVADVPDGWAVLTMDFAENYLCRQQDQPQSAYFGYTQVTVHPCVLYYRCSCGLRVTENWTYVSDVLAHSSSMVDVMLRKVVNYVCGLSGMSKLVIFSDGCSSQYKSKLPFLYLSRYVDCGISIERCFFGARHGKNPCDALGGLLKQAAFRAVQSRRCVIQNAVDLLHFAQDTLQINREDCAGVCSHLTRRYFLLEESEIVMGDSSRLKTVVGTREIHSIRPTQGGLVSRNLCCFCSSCVTSDFSCCVNKKFVSAWRNITVRKFKRSSRVSATLNTGFLQAPDVSVSVLKSRGEVFEDMLSQFCKCSSFEQLEKAVSSVVRMSESFPIPTLVNRSFLDCSGSVDASALRLCPDSVAPLYPFSVEADGNCVPRSFSVLVFGDQDHHVEVRVRIIIEQVLNKSRYLCPDQNNLDFLCTLSDHYSDDVVSTYRSEVLDICRLGTYMGMWQLKAVANVFAARVVSVYPAMGQQCFREFYNVQLDPDLSCNSAILLTVFWSSLREDMNESYWVANHVVPLLPLVVSESVVEHVT